jgi:hypothetical protein
MNFSVMCVTAWQTAVTSAFHETSAAQHLF